MIRTITHVSLMPLEEHDDVWNGMGERDITLDTLDRWRAEHSS